MREGLVLEAVAVWRGKTSIIQSVSTGIARGQIAALIGPNGAGKSTLLGAIAGHLAFSGGIAWNGRRPEASKLGFMPQYCTVLSSLSVLEVLLLGRREELGWQVSGSDLDAAAATLESFGLQGLETRAMNTLSGGQQQLVLLAQRLMREPELLILDEATSALDLRHQVRVLELLSAYVARTGALVLMAMHDLNLAARHTQHLLLLRKGSLWLAVPMMWCFAAIIFGTPTALRQTSSSQTAFQSSYQLDLYENLRPARSSAQVDFNIA